MTFGYNNDQLMEGKEIPLISRNDWTAYRSVMPEIESRTV